MIAVMTMTAAAAAVPVTKLEVSQCDIRVTQKFKYNTGHDYDMTTTRTLKVTSFLGNSPDQKLLSLA